MIGPIPYIGGKNRLANQIIGMFPVHRTYVELFAGGAQVFFHKEPSSVEVLNDLDGELVNFLRVCQNHYEELIRTLNFTVPSRKWFELYGKMDPSTLTDVQKAARFIYLQKNNYAGLVRKKNYHYGVVQRPNYNPRRFGQVLEAASKRLDMVQLESLPYQEVIRRYDRPTTLFYADPPYWGPKLYRYNFEDNDFVELARLLGSIEGKFILSINDRPEVRTTFAAFQIQEVEIVYAARPNPGKRYRELIISNFEIDEATGVSRRLRPHEKRPAPEAGEPDSDQYHSIDG